MRTAIIGRGFRFVVVVCLFLLSVRGMALAQDAPYARVMEVVTMLRRYFLYPIPRVAWDRSLKAASRRVGEPGRLSGRYDVILRSLLARHPRRADAAATSAIRALVNALGDPYTTWLSPAQCADVAAEESSRPFVGIGVEIGFDPRGLRVVAALEGTPARRVGLRPGDVIVAVDGRALRNMGFYPAGNTLMGPPGSIAVLTVLRGRGRVRTVRVPREQITLPPVRGSLLGGQVGYVRISIFGPQTAQQARRALIEQAHAGARAFVIDLRNDPGGDLRNALTLAGLFLPGHVLLRERGREGKTDVRRAPGEKMHASKPMIVLVNGGTASAAEVLAGALSDGGVATLMGKRTFGKGVIQTVVPLQHGGELRVTRASILPPGGYFFQGG